MILNAVFSKVFSEFLLSSYPVYIKLINLSFFRKMLNRFFSFILVSSFFIDLNYIKKYLFHNDGLLLSFYTLIHVYTTHKGYEILKGGVANSILFIYPLIILYFNNHKYYFIYFLILIGLILFSIDDLKERKFTKEAIIEHLKGSGYMILSALTEALIYFSIFTLKTDNNWNQLFISYFFGFLLLLVIFSYRIYNENSKENIDDEKKENKENIDIQKNKENIDIQKNNLESFELKNLNKKENVNVFALVFNIGTAIIGYYLRFYSINKIKPKLYAILSYLGILFTYMFSYMVNKEEINIYNILGSLIIIVCNIYLLTN
jgi:drug/metabolite transporter (DMT)-like permease